MTTIRSARLALAVCAPLFAFAAACSDSSSPGSASPDAAASSEAGPLGDACACLPNDGAVPIDGGTVVPRDPLDPGLAPPVDTNPADYPANVWITNAMAKVREEDPAPATALHWALLSAARNEAESFQVHVHATSAMSAVTFDVSDLHDARSGATIAAATNVVVSRERYLSITQATLSDANGILGQVPDALIPMKDPFFGETRNAFPANVAAGKNVSAWVDVHVAPGTPSGWYTGTVTVSAAGAKLATLPLRLKVWNVDLPATASLRSTFGMSWNGACVQEYGGYAGCGAAVPSNSPDDGVEYFHVLYATFALDHRVSLGAVVYADPTSSGTFTHFDSLYAPLMDGTAKTRLAGAKLTTMNYVGGSSANASLKFWSDHFRAKGWLDRLVYYHCDEPASGQVCNFAQALAEENNAHAVASDLRTLLTADIEDITTGGLLDSVDTLTPVIDQMEPHGQASHRPKYDAFLARSAQKRLYWYQSCDEHESCANGASGGATATWPSYMADASPMRNRAFQWMAYVFGVQGELYYASDLCFAQACGPTGATTNDPLLSIYSFGGNGDGTLYYPGRVSAIGGTHHIPLSSIRFELIREGMEDYELLHMLDAKGDAAFAMQQAQSFIRRADDFDSDPAHLMSAREALGDRLHAKSLP